MQASRLGCFDRPLPEPEVVLVGTLSVDIVADGWLLCAVYRQSDM
jgi:hypothetical protein